MNENIKEEYLKCIEKVKCLCQKYFLDERYQQMFIQNFTNDIINYMDTHVNDLEVYSLSKVLLQTDMVNESLKSDKQQIIDICNSIGLNSDSVFIDLSYLYR